MLVNAESKILISFADLSLIVESVNQREPPFSGSLFTICMKFPHALLNVRLLAFRQVSRLHLSVKGVRQKKKVNCFSGPPSSVSNAPHLSFFQT